MLDARMYVRVVSIVGQGLVCWCSGIILPLFHYLAIMVTTLVCWVWMVDFVAILLLSLAYAKLFHVNGCCSSMLLVPACCFVLSLSGILCNDPFGCNFLVSLNLLVHLWCCFWRWDVIEFLLSVGTWCALLGCVLTAASSIVWLEICTFVLIFRNACTCLICNCLSASLRGVHWTRKSYSLDTFV